MVYISPVTKQDIVSSASIPRCVPDHVDGEIHKPLHADIDAPNSPPPETFKDIAEAVNQEAHLPGLPTHKAPDRPLSESSSSDALSAYDSNNHSKGTPPHSPTPLQPCVITTSKFSPLKRKRGVGTFSSTITHTTFSVFISDQDTLALEANEAEQPKTKKAKLHHKKQNVTGSGDIESPFAMSTLVRISAFRIIRDELDVYEAWLPFKHQNNKANIEWRNAMHRWLKTRRALANYKIKLEKAQSSTPVPDSPLAPSRSSPAAVPTRKSVRFDPACLTDEDGYRKQSRFRRESRHYKPGKYTAPEGESWENTNEPVEKAQPYI
ncbi:hypothetical protein MMC32_008376 [Xylographa parallela]|nr:hypothetical protein [Xylographa parallela]